MLYDYSAIGIIILFSIFLSIIIVLASFMITIKKKELDKLSIYECGFDAFQDKWVKVNIRYYLVCILFIIFDLEISFLFPWSLVLNQIKIVGLLTMLIFLIILTIGFIYEWKNEALEWE